MASRFSSGVPAIEKNKKVYISSCPNSVPKVHNKHVQNLNTTVKLGNKKRFDKELIDIKEPFPVTICHLPHKEQF